MARSTPGRGRARIGTSGYQYDHWRGTLYPRQLSRKAWLGHYARRFDTVEINNTFYHLPRSDTFQHWRRAVDEGFCFALKFSRYGSHLKHLAEPEKSVEPFVERARLLGPRLGPILVQLPPHWAPNVERLASFLETVPSDLRWAVEFRDRRWLCEPIYAVLREHGAALCIHDMLDDHPREITASWTYLRFHGERYSGSYSHQRLTAEARRLEALLARGVDAYVYFNNDLEGHAVTNASDLRRYLRRAGPQTASASGVRPEAAAQGT